jgi:hypothetical protein
MFRSKMCFSDTHHEWICPKTVFLSTQSGYFITFLETSSAFSTKKNCINTLNGQAKISFPEIDFRTGVRADDGAISPLPPARPSANPRKQRGVGLSLP